MDNEKVLMLVFKKDNGKTATFSVVYPKESVEGSNVKALGSFMVDNDIIEFNDNSKLLELEKAFIQEVTKNDISLG